VPNQASDLSAFRKFQFQGILASALKESAAHRPQPAFFDFLLQNAIEEGIQVGFAVCPTQVGVVARHTVHRDWANARQRLNQSIKEDRRTIHYLVKARQLQFIGLFGIDALTVHDVAKEKQVDRFGVGVLSQMENLLGDDMQGVSCGLRVPPSGLATVMEVRKEYD